ANCSDTRAVLERIPDEDLPRGVKVPAWDSLTVPLYGGGGFDHIGLNVSEIARKDQGEATAVLQIHIGFGGVPKKNPVGQGATVNASNIVLLGDKGRLVRGVVPADRGSRVVGWVEFSPEWTAEADLIRGKKAFVRPQPGGKGGGSQSEIKPIVEQSAAA